MRRKNEGKTNVGLRDLHLKNQRLSRDFFYLSPKSAGLVCKYQIYYVNLHRNMFLIYKT